MAEEILELKSALLEMNFKIKIFNDIIKKLETSLKNEQESYQLNQEKQLQKENMFIEDIEKYIETAKTPFLQDSTIEIKTQLLFSCQLLVAQINNLKQLGANLTADKPVNQNQENHQNNFKIIFAKKQKLVKIIRVLKQDLKSNSTISTIKLLDYLDDIKIINEQLKNPIMVMTIKSIIMMMKSTINSKIVIIENQQDNIETLKERKEQLKIQRFKVEITQKFQQFLITLIKNNDTKLAQSQELINIINNYLIIKNDEIVASLQLKNQGLDQLENRLITLIKNNDILIKNNQKYEETLHTINFFKTEFKENINSWQKFAEFKMNNFENETTVEQLSDKISALRSQYFSLREAILGEENIYQKIVKIDPRSDCFEDKFGNLNYNYDLKLFLNHSYKESAFFKEIKEDYQRLIFWERLSTRPIINILLTLINLRPKNRIIKFIKKINPKINNLKAEIEQIEKQYKENIHSRYKFILNNFDKDNKNLLTLDSLKERLLKRIENDYRQFLNQQNTFDISLGRSFTREIEKINNLIAIPPLSNREIRREKRTKNKEFVKELASNYFDQRNNQKYIQPKTTNKTTKII